MSHKEGAVIKPLVAGNWKMNGLKAMMAEVAAISGALCQSRYACDVLLCPPATLLALLADKLSGSGVVLGGQDCHVHARGAHTGDIAAEMLKDAGATAVIVGHSERRADHGEASALVGQKVLAAHRAGLTAIVCIGETVGERQAGLTACVIKRQLEASLPDDSNADNVVVAYEPVWAMGTGLTPTPENVGEIHTQIRDSLSMRFKDGERFRLLYGGSVKPENAPQLMAARHVNGALVGGASLKAEDFLGIIACYGDK